MSTPQLSNVKTLIIDMDGVIWKGNQPIGNLELIFSKLKSHNINFIFATNNSTKDESQYINTLAQFGVIITPEQIITSSIATADLLQQNFPPKSPVYLIGEEGLHKTMNQYGYINDEVNAVAVVAGLNRNATYKDLETATYLINNKGTKFFGTNPDTTLPTPQGMAPGAGAILAAIEASTGIKPIIAGKPSPHMINLAMKRAGTSLNETLMVGDRLETDILGGMNAGCLTALVLSGVSTQQQLANSPYKPDFVMDTLQSLVDQITQSKN